MEKFVQKLDAQRVLIHADHVESWSWTWTKTKRISAKFVKNFHCVNSAVQIKINTLPLNFSIYQIKSVLTPNHTYINHKSTLLIIMPLFRKSSFLCQKSIGF